MSYQSLLLLDFLQGFLFQLIILFTASEEIGRGNLDTKSARIKS